MTSSIYTTTLYNLVRRNPNLTAALIYVFALLICFEQLVFGDAAVKWDAFRLWYPWKHFITNEFLNGDLPLWNPYHLGGFPQQADSMTWYPVSWLLGFFTGGYKLITLNIEYLLHLFFAGFGFYKLMRLLRVNWQLAVLLGLSFMLSGFMLGNAQHLGWIVSSAWLPWLFLTLKRLLDQPGVVNMLGFSLIGYLFFAGGYLAIFFIALYVMIGYLIYKFIKNKQIRWRMLGFLIGAVILIGLLSLPILYSFADLSAVLDRAAPTSMGDQFDVNYGGTPLNGLLSMIFPFSSGVFNVIEIEFGTFSTFIGLIPLIMIGVRFNYLVKDKKLLSVFLFALILLLISLGDLTPLRDWISYLPLMDLFRYPTIFRLFSIFFILIVVGRMYEDENIFTQLLKRLRHSKTLIYLGIGIFMISMGIIFFHLGEGTFTWRFFTDPSLHLQSLSENKRIIFSLVVALIMLASLIIGVRIFKNYSKTWIAVIWVVELLVVAHISTSNVVNEPVSVYSADSRLDQQPYRFEKVIDDHALQEQKNWSDYLDYAWEGKSILLKQPSVLGFSPIKLRTNQPHSNAKRTSNSAGFSSVVNIDDYSLVDKEVSFQTGGTSNWKILPKALLASGEYILIKQRKTDGWTIVSPEISAVDFRATEEGYMILKADGAIHLEYTKSFYWIVFIVSSIMLVAVLILLFFLTLKKKQKWNLIFFTILLISVVLLQNQSRWFPNHVPKITWGKITSCLDHKKLEEHLFNVRRDEVYVLRNTPKTDRFLDELNYFFDRSGEYSTGTLFTKYEREGKVRTPLFSLSGDAFKSDGYQIDIGRLKQEGKINNRIYISLRFRQLQDSDIQLWLNHSKNGKWMDGKAWDISESISTNKENKLLIRSIDLNKYQITDNSSLKLYLSSDEALNGLEVQELRLEHYD